MTLRDAQRQERSIDGNDPVTLFEYLAIAYSLVFSFAALRLVAGLPHAMDPARRYSTHVIYVCMSIFATTALFWTFWSSREAEWTFPRFLLQLSGPGMVYYLACVLIPDQPSLVESWQDYFFSVRSRYFGGLCIWAVVMMFNSTLLLDTPLLHPVRLVQVGVLTLGVAGLASDDPRVHRLILVWGALLVVLATVVLLRPGPLAAAA